MKEIIFKDIENKIFWHFLNMHLNFFIVWVLTNTVRAKYVYRQMPCKGNLARVIFS